MQLLCLTSCCGLQLDDWDHFDVFRVSELSQQRPLEAVTLAMYQRFQLIDKLRLPVGKLRAFLSVRSLLLRLCNIE